MRPVAIKRALVNRLQVQMVPICRSQRTSASTPILRAATIKRKIPSFATSIPGSSASSTPVHTSASAFCKHLDAVIHKLTVEAPAGSPTL